MRPALRLSDTHARTLLPKSLGGNPTSHHSRTNCQPLSRMSGNNPKGRFDFGAKVFFDGLQSIGAGRLTAVAWLVSFVALAAYVASEDASGGASATEHPSVTADMRRWVRAAVTARLTGSADEGGDAGDSEPTRAREVVPKR